MRRELGATSRRLLMGLRSVASGLIIVPTKPA